MKQIKVTAENWANEIAQVVWDAESGTTIVVDSEEKARSARDLASRINKEITVDVLSTVS